MSQSEDESGDEIDMSGFEVVDELSESDETADDDDQTTGNDGSQSDTESSTVSSKGNQVPANESVSLAKNATSNREGTVAVCAKTESTPIPTNVEGKTVSSTDLVGKATPTTVKPTVRTSNPSSAKTPTIKQPTTSTVKSSLKLKSTPATGKPTPLKGDGTTATVKITPTTTKTTSTTAKITPIKEKSAPPTVKRTPTAVKSTPAAVKSTPAAMKIKVATVKSSPAMAKKTPTVKNAHATVKSTPITDKSAIATAQTTPASTTKTTPATLKIKISSSVVKTSTSAVKSNASTMKNMKTTASPMPLKTTPISVKITSPAPKQTSSPTTVKNALNSSKTEESSASGNITKTVMAVKRRPAVKKAVVKLTPLPPNTTTVTLTAADLVAGGFTRKTAVSEGVPCESKISAVMSTEIDAVGVTPVKITNTVKNSSSGSTPSAKTQVSKTMRSQSVGDMTSISPRPTVSKAQSTSSVSVQPVKANVGSASQVMKKVLTKKPTPTSSAATAGKRVVVKAKQVQHVSKETVTPVLTSRSFSTQTPKSSSDQDKDDLEITDVVKQRIAKRQERLQINHIKTVIVYPVQPKDLADPVMEPFFHSSHCVSARFMCSRKGFVKKGHLEIRFFTEEDAKKYADEMSSLTLTSGKHLSSKILGHCGPWDGTLNDWQKLEMAEQEGLKNGRCVYVSQIPAHTDEHMLHLLFPEICGLSLHLPRDDHQASGYALLEFPTSEIAETVANNSQNYETRIGNNVLQLSFIGRRSLKSPPPSEPEDKPQEEKKEVAKKRPADSKDDIKKESPKKPKKEQPEMYKGQGFQSRMKDIKVYLFHWSSCKHAAPVYTFSSASTKKTGTRITCEVRIEGVDYVGTATETTKKCAQNIAAYDFVQYLIREDLVSESSVQKCKDELMRLGYLPDPNKPVVEKPKPDPNIPPAKRPDSFRFWGCDPKALLWQFCSFSKNKMVPHFTYQGWGPQHQKMFRSELKLPCFSYIGRGTSRVKKGAQNMAAYDFVLYLVREGYLKESHVESCKQDLIKQGFLEDPDKPKRNSRSPLSSPIGEEKAENKDDNRGRPRDRSYGQDRKRSVEPERAPKYSGRSRRRSRERPRSPSSQSAENAWESRSRKRRDSGERDSRSDRGGKVQKVETFIPPPEEPFHTPVFSTNLGRRAAELQDSKQSTAAPTQSDTKGSELSQAVFQTPVQSQSLWQPPGAETYNYSTDHMLGARDFNLSTGGEMHTDCFQNQPVEMRLNQQSHQTRGFSSDWETTPSQHLGRFSPNQPVGVQVSSTTHGEQSRVFDSNRAIERPHSTGATPSQHMGGFGRNQPLGSRSSTNDHDDRTGAFDMTQTIGRQYSSAPPSNQHTSGFVQKQLTHARQQPEVFGLDQPMGVQYSSLTDRDDRIRGFNSNQKQHPEASFQDKQIRSFDSSQTMERPYSTPTGQHIEVFGPKQPVGTQQLSTSSHSNQFDPEQQMNSQGSDYRPVTRRSDSNETQNDRARRQDQPSQPDQEYLKKQLIASLKDLQEGRLIENTDMLTNLAEQLLIIQGEESKDARRSQPEAQQPAQESECDREEVVKAEHAKIREQLLLRMQCAGIHSGTLTKLVSGLKTVQTRETAQLQGKGKPAAPIDTARPAFKKSSSSEILSEDQKTKIRSIQRNQRIVKTARAQLIAREQKRLTSSKVSFEQSLVEAQMKNKIQQIKRDQMNFLNAGTDSSPGERWGNKPEREEQTRGECRQRGSQGFTLTAMGHTRGPSGLGAVRGHFDPQSDPFKVPQPGGFRYRASHSRSQWKKKPKQTDRPGLGYNTGQGYNYGQPLEGSMKPERPGLVDYPTSP